ncbi:LysE family translocator [Oceanibaculum nanhaiense]|uniref:LysE family translocator n=1 Tax=Oceanibaculum nanhaiense TaxID=1909734 RepID=UPI00396DA2D6
MLTQSVSLFTHGPELWPSLLALLLSALTVMGTPGPSTLSVTAVGAAFGLRRSWRYVLGINLGTISVLLAIAAGIVTMLMSMPRLAPFLLAASLAYILYLAYRIATAPPLAGPVAGEAAGSAPSFLGGYLLGIANPKAYLAISAVFAGSSLPVGDPLLEALAKLAVLSLLIVAIHTVWLLAGVSLSRLLRDPLASRLLNIAFAVILLVTTFWGTFG